jgi:hypothetical protein
MTRSASRAVASPPHQVVGDLSLSSLRRVASAVLASDAEATVCLALSVSEAAFAHAMGVRVCDDARTAERNLAHLGFALVHGEPAAEDAPATARLAMHPAAPLRAVIEVAPGSGRSVARDLAKMDLDAALVVEACVGPGARVWLVKGGAARVVSLPAPDTDAVPSPLAPTYEADAYRLALGGERSPLGEQLAWDAAALLWTGAWMPRFGDILTWTRTRQRRGVDLARYG